MIEEAARRRTFAIISHPDAGKTTLTEKFLLYAGAVQRAGAVKARDGRRVGDLGLDGARAPAGHLDQLDGAAVPVPRPRRQPARHARPPRLLRGHLPGARRRRRRRDGARHGEGHRVPDAEAVRGLPRPPAAGADVPQQVRPPGPRAARAARRDRGARSGCDPTPATWPVGIAGDLRGVIDRRTRRVHPLHPHRPRGVAGARGARARPTSPPPRRARHGRSPRTRSACSTPSAPTSTRRRSSPATRRPCSSGRR